ncbi:helix-turn-helix domain-containing protein [Sinomonas albida]|uniref:helix-turn-helix domain-containing protein n=1 Tax=Sinomonas albida TaxID=369942 RepID=UPI0030167387
MSFRGSLVEVLAEYSKQARPKLAKFDALDAALTSVNAVRADDRSVSARPRQRYRLIDRLGPATLDKLVERYKAGESTNDLAAEYNISKSSLLRLLDTRGIQRRKQGLTPATERQVLKLRAQGLIIRDIAKQVGVSYDTARLFLFEHGKQREQSA